MLDFTKIGTTFRPTQEGGAQLVDAPQGLRTPPPDSEIRPWGPTRDPQGRPMSVLKPNAGASSTNIPAISPNQARVNARDTSGLASAMPTAAPAAKPAPKKRVAGGMGNRMASRSATSTHTEGR